MKFDYDKETDSLYIEFASGAGADNILITDDIVADIDRNGRLVGLDIQYASKNADLQHFMMAGMFPEVQVAR